MSSQRPSPSRKQSRERLAEQRRAQQEAERRRERSIRIVAVVAAIVLVAGGTALAFVLNRPDPGAALPDGVSGPGSGVATGTASAPVVDVWEDFQCPFCGQAHKTVGPALRELAESGAARVVYHPLAIIGPESERASNAFGCAVDAGRGMAFHDVLFDNQPAENTGGYTVADLLRFGEQAGITGDQFATCVRDGTYNGWVEQVNASMSDAGVQGTPTIFVAGKELPRVDVPGGYAAADLRQAVAAAG